jgi:hypothetical protein
VGYQNGMGHHLYAVTAKHVITGIQAEDIEKVSFRLNFSDKPLDYLESSLADWRFHPTDRAADVAVLPVELPDGTDHLSLPAGIFLRPEVAADKNLTVGDVIFYTGLFWQLTGAKRNAPIARIGNIAAMPGEPIETEDGPMDAYLVEARSMGGLSGSPVFIDLGGQRPSVGVIATASPEYYLIGVAHGHWDAPDRDGQSVNMGIAIVTPANKIAEALEGEELKAMRQRVEREAAKKHFPKKDRG